MYQASDPVTLYLNLLGRELTLDRWARRRVLAEIEDHLREAADHGATGSPESFFGDHQKLARDLMLAWLERRYLSLKLLLVVAAIVTAIAMFAIKELSGGSSMSAAGAATLVHLFNRGTGLIALGTIGTALWAVRARTFNLGRVGLFTKLAGGAALLLSASVAGEVLTLLLVPQSIAPGQVVQVAALVSLETITVSMALGMWRLASRVLTGLG